MKRLLTNQNFSSGIATDKKIAPPNSFANSQSIDFRRFPSQFTLLPAPYREDDGVVVDLIQNEVMVADGTIYAIGSEGYFYRRTTSGNWSVIGNLDPGTYGILWRPDQDYIYIASETAVSQYGPLSNNPILQSNFYADSMSTYNNSTQMGFNVSTLQNSGTETTSIGTTIVETDNTKRFFQTDIQPINKIGIKIADRGTGDWTVTVHDGLNNIIGASTVVNASLTNDQFNYFEFADPLQVTVAPGAQTYHIHVTSTVPDGTVYSTAVDDLRTADLEIWADRLQTTENGLHPMAQIQQFVVIGNGRYLSVWEPLGEPEPSNSSWQRQKLQFPPQYTVCGLANTNEYVAIACEVVSDNDSDPQDGIIFFWDGLADTYNFFIRITEGSPEGLMCHKNTLFYVVNGIWYALQPFSEAQPQKLTTIDRTDSVYAESNNATKVFPNAMTVRNNILLTAYPSTTDNPLVSYGVYSYGRVDNSFPDSFGYSYVLSTGSQHRTPTNDLTIGMVKNFGDTLHISWRDDSNETGAYGVDVVNSGSKVPTFATWESLIFDNGYTGKQKEAHYIDATWLPLPEGATIRLKYSINRGDWIYSQDFNNNNLYETMVGYARWYIGEQGTQARFNEIQIGVDVICEEGLTESPTVTSVTLIYDNLGQEALD